MKLSTISRLYTVLGLEPGTSKEQGELVIAPAMWPGSSSHGFSFKFERATIFAICHYVCGFVIHILVFKFAVYIS